ncbi:MAG: helix-turn-helix transcriptional regulator, partial [Firmicutes bacterium]|nr:helix-turn-helix transcriptional regulator [Bacillota bacterium]
MFNNKSLLAGSTSMLILELVRNEDMYGYQITERLRTISDNTFDIKAGTLYPLLHSLEKDGLVSVYEQPVNGKLRKYYAITE